MLHHFASVSKRVANLVYAKDKSLVIMLLSVSYVHNAEKMCSSWQENGGNCSLINHNGVLVINIYVMHNHNNRYNNVVLRPGISGVKHSTMMKTTRENLRNLTNSAWTQRDWLSRVVSASRVYNYYTELNL